MIDVAGLAVLHTLYTVVLFCTVQNTLQYVQSVVSDTVFHVAAFCNGYSNISQSILWTILVHCTAILRRHATILSLKWAHLSFLFKRQRHELSRCIETGAVEQTGRGSRIFQGLTW
jgi:hypothetical protein